ncbi:hypothetical protein B0T20DRAFT_504460 [Sordaria brevicollis]|uniref:Uncharacterized protein n=1 Tax=Sordaria brevicollis TaxID=83679 RepID=A0AAE0UF60_SORBR|nr:hypothetical protein B0T20DRAFT_504460 [Sordaria brevicollis]
MAPNLTEFYEQDIKAWAQDSNPQIAAIGKLGQMMLWDIWHKRTSRSILVELIRRRIYDAIKIIGYGWEISTTKMPADAATKLLAQEKLRDLERLRDVASTKAPGRSSELDDLVTTLRNAIATASDTLQENVSACERALQRWATYRDYPQGR